MAERLRIVEIVLDGTTIAARSPQVAHERRVAIHDLLEGNRFIPAGSWEGPFRLHLGLAEGRLVLGVAEDGSARTARIVLPLQPFRAVIRDYFAVCDSYYMAIRTASASRIEAIDVGRRSLHDEGATLLRERLAAHAEIDGPTARRLFTLLCTLHFRGEPGR